jgi:hypothetical protein
VSDIIVKDTAKRKGAWKKWAGVLALLMVSACLVAVVWVWWQVRNWEPFTAIDYYPTHPGNAALSYIEGNADIVLPSSARDIYVYTTGFREIDTFARFSMSANELDEFMESTSCQQSLKRVNYELGEMRGQISEWWTPNQAERLDGCNGSKGHIHQTIMVDRTRQDVYVVFVMASTY